MREPQFDRLRSEVADAVRQPEFSTVQARAGKVRRRRAATTSAVFLVTVLAAASFGYTVQNSPPDYGSLDPIPEVTCTQDCSWPWITASASTGSELYGLVVTCQDCDSELYVSSDDGGSWQARSVPPAPGDVPTPREVTLTAPGPGLLVWSERTFTGGVVETQSTGGPTAGPTAPASILKTWISRDGGKNWIRPEATTEPTGAVPAGARPVDCDLVEAPDCKVGVLDPASGRFSPLATQPTGITVEPGWSDRVRVPISDRLWVSGLDPVTEKPAVATSSDAGRTWKTHVFTDGAVIPAGNGWPASMFAPKIAAGPDATAYVVTQGDDGFRSHYTADGGATWQTGQLIERARAWPGYVTADGAHIVPTDQGAVTAHGTGRYTQVTLSGMPEGAIRTVEITTGQADLPYLMPTSGAEAYLSKDGMTWQQVRLP
ncbi:hypothetical protein Q0Z83_049560 [Actinoplanes sichuanensis]|uniref:Exo-alpha-sialidase n=1 Tax=Actinoplanes sichuanensis TaxID=512349 RepID=A0ABW4AN05_9ACTN|nr:hypothetical protein [Actinoplanes sichuanensis]BEL06765.1 hypothetical protein Q0Z83_049560 [Actinoplanes sichuanensis]